MNVPISSDIAAPGNQRETYLKVGNLSKVFGSFKALNDVSFEICEGEFICFLGPSGCGKTTLLRCIAGLETHTSGTIHQGGVDVSRVPPSGRDFGIVFQSYALFPNLTVGRNVGYGLVNMKQPKSEVSKKVVELLDLVNLGTHIDKFPSQLSGGEQQRVALIRAIATSPGLLLLDEPLSALDAKVRAYLRREIRSLQKKLGVTTIMVTHDQEEAQTMADRIIVMSAGRIEQMGTPREIYEHPASPFVADFIGEMNSLHVSSLTNDSITSGSVTLKASPENIAKVHKRQGDRIVGAIRPEDVQLDSPSSENSINACVNDIEYLGDHIRVYLDIAGIDAERFSIKLAKSDAAAQSIQPGDSLNICIPSQAIHVLAASN